MSYLVDTDILSLLERKTVPQKLVDWAENNSGWFVSVITLAELEFGLQQAPKAHQEPLAKWIGNLRAGFADSTLPLDEPVLVRWKQLLAELKKKNRTMSCEDSLIAATALQFGFKVVTRNKKHFEPSGVECVNPLE